MNTQRVIFIIKRLRNKSAITIITYAFVFADISAQNTATAGSDIETSNEKFSIAGFYNFPNSGRETFNFNVGWRFLCGDAADAEKSDFDDSRWELVSTPHTVMLVPAEGSGSRNYQGIAWYRKHFTVPENLQNKLVTIYFEAAMGKSEVYLNGKKILEHLGGYLPFATEITQYGVKAGDKVVIAVKVDNSDDKNYPPGKQQTQLDFCYHGGIYRDVWLIATSKIHITDANFADKVAGGGIRVVFGEISRKKAVLTVKTDIENLENHSKSITLESKIIDPQGKIIKTVKSKISLKSNESKSTDQNFTVENPQLWHPDSPFLYKVQTSIVDGKTALDGGITRIGIRKIEFRGKDGLYINGDSSGKLIGGNRHQDYAYVGNAVPNSQHRRDAKLLREAGCRIVRSAHYPQDPAWMDACDELGIFMIVPTPGWQFWNNDPQFAELVYADIRNMVRRDRNHASVLMWEPILNETRFPKEFTVKAQQTVHEEFPGAACAADAHSVGVAENYEVVYGWVRDIERYKQPVFTREFGETVDDWYAHNTPNRVSRNWGEQAQVIQALVLAKTYDEMYPPENQFLGGALWHPFDHQRGYHPDPYWGGILDAFRQPKYSYYLFKAQVSPSLAKAGHANSPLSEESEETSAFIFIAHELSPISSPDVTVFTNCDEVRLIVFEQDTFVQKAPKWQMPHPPVIFKEVYDFFKLRNLTYNKKQLDKVSLVAEGLIDGKVVCTTKKMPSRRPDKLRLFVDNQRQILQADGSDFVTVVCEITDADGNVRRLAKDKILFSVEGEGEIIGDETIGANPREVEFGTAPILIRSTVKAGKIKVTARTLFEGEIAPQSANIEFESVIPPNALLYDEKPEKNNSTQFSNTFNRKLTNEEIRKKSEEVEQQQIEFGKEKL
ncbi:MAG: glycoside hydrolase family 2 [Bacteroidales bacterium]|jgi:beta-galactosidase|nr:glycoside hydrolase family 2 [Bacteroidales bacterium]